MLLLQWFLSILRQLKQPLSRDSAPISSMPPPAGPTPSSPYTSDMRHNMSTSFNKAVTWVLELEGYFSDHNQDPGGKTKYGITETTWTNFRKTHPDRDRLPPHVKDISTGHAIAVYEQEYWRKSRCHELAQISEPV